MTQTHSLSRTKPPEVTRRIPLYPALQRKSKQPVTPSQEPAFPGFGDAGAVSGTLNARSAIEIALRTLELPPGSEILVPAYHCPVMIYPIVKLGLVPVWFEVAPDCSIDLGDLQRRLGPRARAVIAVHYFGFPAPLAALRRLCDTHGLYLIEDCAHAFFGWCDGAGIGSRGDVAVASYYKFFPVQDGGAIRFNNPVLRDRQARRSPCPLFFQAKSALNTLELRRDARQANRILDGLLGLTDWLWSRLKRRAATTSAATTTITANSVDESSSDGIFHRDVIAPTYQYWRLPWFCSAVVRTTSYAHVCATRRRNFAHLLALVRGVKGVTPLFATLPETVVPYNFPLICDDAASVAARLRAHGVSVARFGEYFFDEQDRVPGSVAHTYSQNCIQLPIHQSVTRGDLDYIVSILAQS